MQLTNKEQELLSTYKNWLKKNSLSDKCNVYFIEENSMLVFQVWTLEKQISETIWLKTDIEKWEFYVKSLSQKFNKSFSLKEILKIEKDFVIKTWGEKSKL